MNLETLRNKLTIWKIQNPDSNEPSFLPDLLRFYMHDPDLYENQVEPLLNTLFSDTLFNISYFQEEALKLLPHSKTIYKGGYPKHPGIVKLTLKEFDHPTHELPNVEKLVIDVCRGKDTFVPTFPRLKSLHIARLENVPSPEEFFNRHAENLEELVLGSRIAAKHTVASHLSSQVSLENLVLKDPQYLNHVWNTKTLTYLGKFNSVKRCRTQEHVEHVITNCINVVRACPNRKKLTLHRESHKELCHDYEEVTLDEVSQITIKGCINTLHYRNPCSAFTLEGDALINHLFIHEVFRRSFNGPSIQLPVKHLFVSFKDGIQDPFYRDFPPELETITLKGSCSWEGQMYLYRKYEDKLRLILPSEEDDG